MPEKFWDKLGFVLVKMGVGFMTKRHQRQFHLMVSLGAAFQRSMPREHEAILTGDIDAMIVAEKNARDPREDHTGTVH